MGALFSGPPKAPPVPPPPPPPPPAPKPAEAAVSAPGQAATRRAQMAIGPMGTIATSPQGLTTPATTTRKNLTGQ